MFIFVYASHGKKYKNAETLVNCQRIVSSFMSNTSPVHSFKIFIACNSTSDAYQGSFPSRKYIKNASVFLRPAIQVKCNSDLSRMDWIRWTRSFVLVRDKWAVNKK